MRLRRNYGSWDGVTMTIAPSLLRTSLLWFLAAHGAGSSTIIDGRLRLLYFGGLFLGLGRFSSFAPIICLEETQQRPDKNPIASSAVYVRTRLSLSVQGEELTWGRMGRRRWVSHCRGIKLSRSAPWMAWTSFQGSKGQEIIQRSSAG